MKKTLRSLFVSLLLLSSATAFAQTTTSAVNGKITDSKGGDLPGATVQVLYKPTGAVSGVTTNNDGRFTLVNLNPGGPYDVSVTFIGYQTEKIENIYLKLGENLKLNFTLRDEAQTLSEVVVVGQNGANEKTGTATNVGKEQIQALPTLSRSFSDFTRLTPQSSNNSFAGTNFRYNNITLDGAINNDAIGFSPSLGGQSGTANQPGSSTRTNSFSLDAISEVQVQIAPYDVSLGNFTGGSVNAVSRSGSNEVTGSVYGFGRSNAITGKYKGVDKVGSGALPSGYRDGQTGFRVGFPIIKNKLFFFTNEEVTDNTTPVLFPAGAPNYFMTTAIANSIINHLSTLHNAYTANLHSNGDSTGYNPGAIGAYSIFSRSRKFFNRLDWVINANHSLAIRNNSIISSASNLERSTNEFQFGNYDFIQKNRNISTVAELKSRFGNNVSNSLIIGYTDIKDSRNPTGDPIFPQIQINGIGSGHALLGTNREAGIFNMRQRTFEFTDNLKFFSGNHIFTIGTHNEFYKIDYNFINSWNGRFDYNSVADFLNDKPSRMRYIYSNTDNSRPTLLNSSPAKFSVALTSLYLQDEFAVNTKLLLTYGVRGDLPLLPTGPPTPQYPFHITNQGNYGTTYDYTTPISQINNNKILGKPYVSPRVGFNYDVKGDQSLILRGGSGLFTGRIPFAWLGYAFVNNGSTYYQYDVKGQAAGTVIPTDPSSFAKYAGAAANRRELDVIDKNFSMPRMWRSNIAADIKFGDGYKLTLEAIYTKTIKDMQIKQVNLKDSVFYAPNDPGHQQPLYLSATSGSTNTGNRVDNHYSSVYLITNTNKGARYQLTAQISKQYPFGLSMTAAYTYGMSKDILNGIRNSPESGWQLNQALNPNNPGLTYSNFDIRHRIVSSFMYKKSWNPKNTSYISLVYTSQSGSPFTYAITSSNNLTANGQQADLAFIPQTLDQINLVDRHNADGTTTTAAQQWVDLDNFIKGDKYLSTHRGQFTSRNGARTPWNNNLDLRLMHDFGFDVGGGKLNRLQITFDIINLSNLIDKKWGVVYFTPNTLNSSVDLGLTVARPGGTAAPTYTFKTPTATYSTDQFASRWQGQLGVRYIF